MTWDIEPYKKGRRRYGAFLKNRATGVVIYLAYRWHKEIFRCGEVTISDAQRKGVACWAIDNDTLQLAKIKGVKYVGVKLKDTGSLYLAPIDEFFDSTNAKVMNYTAKGGSLQRYLPVDQFKAIIKTKIT